MSNFLTYPTEEIASSAVLSMTGENILYTQIMATGDQHFVCAVKTEKSDTSPCGSLLAIVIQVSQEHEYTAFFTVALLLRIYRRRQKIISST